ncbi:MAG: T9SS type A sorting domain-containing protein [bacterium]|nr:MAG: T9SS type A sorting domain-containing protein [bacterium]
MKKYWTGIELLVILAVALSAGTGIASESKKLLPEFRITSATNDLISMEFTFPDFEASDTLIEGKTYQVLHMSDMGYLTRVGFPRLPQTTRLLGIGPSGEYRVRISGVKYEEIDQILIFPAQPKLTREDQRQEFVIDRQFYQTDSWFPQAICTAEDPAILRDVRVLPLNICPFQYNPAQKTVRAVRMVMVTIEKTGNTGLNPIKIGNQRLDQSFLPLYRSYILNFNEMPRYFENEINGLPNMLIITHDQYFQTVQPFAQWKNEKGVETLVVKTSEIGVNPSADQIKAFIGNYYQAAADKPDYLLLVGDVTGSYAIPWFSVSGSMSDHPYYQLEGNDILPDISGGRISVQTEAEAQIVFTKLIQYEKTPFLGNPGWFQSSLVINSNDFQDPQAGNWAKAQFLAYGYNPVHHLGDNLGNATVANVYSAVNSGVSYIFYIGHGAASSWSTTGFSTSNIPNLTNGAMQPVISSVACNNADLDVPYDVFAEVWLKNSTDKGSVGIMAFTESCSVYETDTLGRGMVRALLSDTIPAFGNIIDFGRLHMFQSFGLGSSSAMYQSLLVGEPELQVWTRTPENLLVNVPASAFFNSPISVQVSDQSGPVGGALVCYWDSLGNYQRLYTDGSGTVTLNPGIAGPVNGKITITAHNYIPVQIPIDIIPPNGPYVLVKDLVILDTLSNNNGIIESGEHFFFQFQIENIGVDPAVNVMMNISSPDTNIAILKDTSTIGTLSASAMMTAGRFEARVDSTCPHLYAIPLLIDMIADGGHNWQQNYWMRVRKGSRIQISADTLSFPATFLNFATDLSVEVYNEGPDTLWVQDIISSLPQFSTSPGIFGVSPGSSFPVTIRFTPDTVQNFLGSIEFLNNDPVRFRTRLMAQGSGVLAPDIEVVDSLRLYAAANDSLVESLRISNTGAGDLIFSAQTAGYRPGSSSPEGSGGADTFGHIWVDSDEPSGPVYNWIDISGSGSMLSLTGNNLISDPVNLGFSFSFYGQEYTNLRICTNGWVSFSTVSVAYNNLALPDPLAPRNLIAPMWDDLLITPNSAVYTENQGNKFVVSFLNMERVTGEGPYSFQVVLYDNGNILLQYMNLNQLLHDYTVGIQNQNGLDGLTIAHNETYLKDSLAILISRHSWLSVQPAGGTIAPGDYLDLQLTIRTSNFPFGEFYAAVQIESNDPDESLVLIPIHLSVGLTGLESVASQSLPRTIQLSPNFPNPFNPTTTIRYGLPEGMNIELAVYNMLGQKLKTLYSGRQAAGFHTVYWDATNENGDSMASGVYIYRLKTANSSFVGKMILMR